MSRSTWVLGIVAVIASALLAARWSADEASTSSKLSEPSARRDSTGSGHGHRQRVESQRSEVRRPVVVRSAEAESTDSRSADYNPIRLARTGEEPIELFEKEHRNEDWAIPREQGLREIVTRDLREVLPEAQVSTVECRSMMCRLVVSGPEKRADQMMFSLQWTMLGPRMTILDTKTSGGMIRQELVVFYDDKTYGPHEFREWYREMRAKAIEQWESTGGPPYPIPKKLEPRRRP